MPRNLYNIDALTYQPSTNMDWFTKAIFGGILIEKGKITPVPGVKKSTLLNLLSLVGNILQSDGRDCAWTPEQIAKLSEKEVEVKNFKINLEQCLDDLERKRTIHMLSPGAKNTELPDSLEEATMALLAVELSKEIETKIFAGDSNNSGEFDGVTKVLTNSTSAIKIVGVALTKDNVLGEIAKSVAALPDDVLAKGLVNGFENNLCIYVGFQTLLKARMAFADTRGSNVVIDPNFTLEGNLVRYMGIELVPVWGIGANDIVVADSGNMLLATDLMSDLEQIRLGQFPAPNDNKIFIDGELRLGFAIPFEDEVVFYSPTNPAPIVDPIVANVMLESAFGYDGVSPVIDGIDQTPIQKLPKVGDLIADISASESIQDIEALLNTEAHTLRNSENVKNAGLARINELKGGA